MAKKVLLIQPNYSRQRSSGVWRIAPPMGLAYIAAFLEEKGIPVKILDANALNLSVEETKKEAENYGAEIIGVSILTPGHNFAAELVKKLPSAVLSVAGGAQATAVPELILKEGFKVVVRGEGEETFFDLASGKNLSEIDGISFTKDGQVIHNKNREPQDPNILPLPARHLLIKNGVDLPYASEATQYFPWAVITTSRGCPYDCYYCNKLIFGRKIRYLTPENVLKEIDFLVKNYGIKEISVSDDCFNFDLPRAKKILDLIASRDYKIKIRFSNGLRADKIDKEFLEKAKKAGCNYIALGVESGSQEILDRIPKGESLETIEKAVKMIKKSGIPVTCFFMLGLLGDTKETMEKTIAFAKKLNPDIASFNIATPYPGTRMWQLIKDSGGQILMDSWDDFHHTASRAFYSFPGMSDNKTIEEMLKKAVGQFYFRPSYVLKQVFRIRSFSQIKNMARGLKTILKIKKK
jgi:anaerobic magnesium-protoporphyrin IX monomethyl ester cyclase